MMHTAESKTTESQREKQREHTNIHAEGREREGCLHPSFYFACSRHFFPGQHFLLSRSVAKYERKVSLWSQQRERDSCFYATCSAIEMRFEKGAAGEKCRGENEPSFSPSEGNTQHKREMPNTHTVHITQRREREAALKNSSQKDSTERRKERLDAPSFSFGRTISTFDAGWLHGGANWVQNGTCINTKPILWRHKITPLHNWG